MCLNQSNCNAYSRKIFCERHLYPLQAFKDNDIKATIYISGLFGGRQRPILGEYKSNKFTKFTIPHIFLNLKFAHDMNTFCLM